MRLWCEKVNKEKGTQSYERERERERGREKEKEEPVRLLESVDWCTLVRVRAPRAAVVKN